MVKPKLIMMAAGMGTRLRPFTEDTPKCLFKVNKNETIIERTIKIFEDRADISVVGGFHCEDIKKVVPKVNVIYNPFYSITNSISSLWFARDLLEGDLILMNADVVIEKKIVDILISDLETSVLIDSSRIQGADYKVATHNGKVVMMGKDLSIFSGEYVGAVKINSKDTGLFKNKIDNMIAKGQFNEWFETALVDLILSEDFCLRYIDICGLRWTEVDTSDDLLNIKKMSIEE